MATGKPEDRGGRRVALVTGGTRGIGLGIARALAADGWSLALCGIRPEDAVRDVLDGLRAVGRSAAGRDAGTSADADPDDDAHPQVVYTSADLASRDDRARLVEFAYARYGSLQALVNNAGIAPRMRADLLESREESFEELLRTNLQGPYFLTQQIAARMTADRRAAAAAAAAPSRGVEATSEAAPAESREPSREAIVFVTSVSAEMASPNRGEYCVSKAGLAMTAKLFAARLAEFAIPVYEVRPGIIATDMTAKVKDVYDRRIADGLIPERRWGTPDDVGRAVATLLRGDVPYATGSVIHIDGGLSIPRL
jgi:NAD(P)-dependent dehydrogenase (short-subunit alcohol dehydrogenase family)